MPNLPSFATQHIAEMGFRFYLEKMVLSNLLGLGNPQLLAASSPVHVGRLNKISTI